MGEFVDIDIVSDLSAGGALGHQFVDKLLDLLGCSPCGAVGPVEERCQFEVGLGCAVVPFGGAGFGQARSGPW